MGVPDTAPVFQGGPDKGFVTFLFNTIGATSEITLKKGDDLTFLHPPKTIFKVGQLV